MDSKTHKEPKKNQLPLEKVPYPFRTIILAKATSRADERPPDANVNYANDPDYWPITKIALAPRVEVWILRGRRGTRRVRRRRRRSLSAAFSTCCCRSRRVVASLQQEEC